MNELVPNDPHAVLDQLLAAERERENALAEAVAADRDRNAEHDGSDLTWHAVERAQALVKRRTVELQMARTARGAEEARLAEAARLAKIEIKDAVLVLCGPDAFERTVADAVEELRPHFVALQLGLGALRDAAADYSSARAEVRALDQELATTTRVGAEVTGDEFLIAVAVRLVALARAEGFAADELVDLPVARPFALEERALRGPDRSELLCAVPHEMATLSCSRARFWRDCARQLIGERRSAIEPEANEEKENDNADHPTDDE